MKPECLWQTIVEYCTGRYICFEKNVNSRGVSWTARRIKPVNPKGNQLGIFTGKIDAEAPILWPSNAKSQLIGKDPHARKD